MEFYNYKSDKIKDKRYLSLEFFIKVFILIIIHGSIKSSISFQNVTNFFELIDIVLFQDKRVFFLFISQNCQEFNASKSLANSVLECLVLLVDSSEFFLSIVFNDVVNVDLSCLEKRFSQIWVSMITHFNLLALKLYLFDQ